MVAGASTPQGCGPSLRSLRDPQKLLPGDTALEEEPAERTMSLEQLLKGRSYGTMLLESGFMELGKEDGGAEQRAQQREAELEKRQR